MGAAEELVEEIELYNLVPLNTLNPESLDELISQSTIKRLPPGRHIFNQGDNDNATVYLLSGQLALIAEGVPAITIKAGTCEALNPISDQQPRSTTALARTCVTTLTIDTLLFNKFFSHPENSENSSDTNDTASKDKRIRQALQIPLLTRLPLPHKQVLMHRFEEIKANKGDVIVQKGSDSKNYYLITEGRCGVTEKTDQPPISLDYSELTAGCGFEEEALITNSSYKFTVTMLENGRLLTLSRGEFMALLVRPLIQQLPYQQVRNLDKDDAILLDLRTPIAFRRSHLDGSVNFPFSVFKDTVSILDKNREYIICSDSPQRSIVAAFLLLKQGLDAKILNQSIRKTLISTS